MKRVFFIVLFLVSISGFSQLKKPAEGKAMVYFVRSEQMGFLINFKYFDNEKYLGKFNYGKYLAYECEPGKHLFWSKSENIDFLEADLEAGKVYIVDSEPRMGAFKAGVSLVPFENNPVNFKTEKKYIKKKEKILKSISDQTAYVATPEDLSEDVVDLVKKAMEKYAKNKSDATEMKQLNMGMDYKE